LQIDIPGTHIWGEISFYIPYPPSVGFSFSNDHGLDTGPITEIRSLIPENQEDEIMLFYCVAAVPGIILSAEVVAEYIADFRLRFKKNNLSLD